MPCSQSCNDDDTQHFNGKAVTVSEVKSGIKTATPPIAAQAANADGGLSLPAKVTKLEGAKEMTDLAPPPTFKYVEQLNASRTNLAAEAMMRLHFKAGELWCEDSTGDSKSENHNIIIWSSAPNPNNLGIKMSATDCSNNDRNSNFA